MAKHYIYGNEMTSRYIMSCRFNYLSGSDGVIRRLACLFSALSLFHKMKGNVLTAPLLIAQSGSALQFFLLLLPTSVQHLSLEARSSSIRFLIETLFLAFFLSLACLCYAAQQKIKTIYTEDVLIFICI